VLLGSPNSLETGIDKHATVALDGGEGETCADALCKNVLP
jgi:hypothetical protein